MRNQRENPALEALKHPFAADIPADFHRLVVDRFSCLSERHELKLFILNVLCDYWFFAREWTARIWTDLQVLERGEGGGGGVPLVGQSKDFGHSSSICQYAPKNGNSLQGVCDAVGVFVPITYGRDEGRRVPAFSDVKDQDPVGS
jgi:hypothetical protein